MADLKDTAEQANELGKSLGLTSDQIKKAKGFLDELAAHQGLKELKTQAQDAKNSFEGLNASMDPIRAKLASSTNIIGQLGAAIYSTSNNAVGYTAAFQNLIDGTQKVGGVVGFVGNAFGTLVGGIDGATRMSKEFRGATIGVSSELGLGLNDARNQYQSYTLGIMEAMSATYETRAQVEAHAASLARAGISVEDWSKSIDVAGTNQNMLRIGLLVGQETGLGSAKTFEYMATSMRKMGLSAEDSTRPLLALQAMSKSTGLPLTELSDKMMGLVERNARFGTTVEGLSPIVRRFADVLGDGFKGFAISDVSNLIDSLGRSVNTTQAAFMSMNSGMGRPNTGVAGAMLDFEDAMAKPEEAMKMLSTSLGSITGGKILTFEDAHANENAAMQFKIQRDLLAQLTGINDPQQTKTLMALLADQQSGREMSAEDTRTLEEAMKSGADKQAESKSLAEKIGQAQVGLLAQIQLSLSNMATSFIKPQTESALVRTGENLLSGYTVDAKAKLSELINRAVDLSKETFDKNAPQSIKDGIDKFNTMIIDPINKSIDKNNSIESPRISVGAMNPGERTLASGGPSFKFNGAEIPQQTNQIPERESPTPTFGGVAANQSATADQSTNSSTVSNEGNLPTTNININFTGDGELTKAMARSAMAAIEQIYKGH